MDENIFDNLFSQLEKTNPKNQMYGFDVFEEHKPGFRQVTIMDSSISMSSEEEVFITRHVLRIHEI